MGTKAFWGTVVAAAFAVLAFAAPPEWFSADTKRELAIAALVLLVAGSIFWIAAHRHERSDNSGRPLEIEVNGPYDLLSQSRLLVLEDYATQAIGEMKDDPTSQLVDAVDPDLLPVDSRLKITAISYGEGSQIETIDEERLWRLSPEVMLSNCKDWVEFDNGYRYILKTLFSDSERDRLRGDQFLHYPRELSVSIHKTHRDNWVSLSRISDIRYVQGYDHADRWRVNITSTNDRGGLAAFLDAHGQYQAWNPYVFGDESNCLGAVSILVAIEWDGDTPLCRSHYIPMVRKGIRYPEDIWMSNLTKRPFLSPSEGSAFNSRFIFQSREPAGMSTDVFVADFNGENLSNLTESNRNAYDGLYDATGAEVAKWLSPQKIQYGSMVNGVKVTAIAGDPITSPIVC